MWKFLLLLLVAVTFTASDALKPSKKKNKSNLACECLDICIIIDTSFSITEEFFGDVLDFICDFFDTFNNPPDDIHFGAIEFSTIANEVFKFTDSCNQDPDYSECKEKIRDITLQNGNTNHKAALEKALEFFPSDGDRPDNECPDVIIFITDGVTVGGGDPVPVAVDLRNNRGVTIFAVGIGNIDQTLLENIAGSEDRVFITTFAELRGEVNALRTSVCDSDEFDPDCQTCCCGVIFGDHHKPIPDRRSKCCGQIRYDPRKNKGVCCQGYFYPGYHDKYTRCCYDKPFDYRYYTCCYNKIVPATRTQDQCCGFAAYNQKHQICCNYRLFRKRKHTQCCYDYAYDPRCQICCRYKVSEGSSYTYRCCGTKAYDPYEEICCNPYHETLVENPVKHCGKDISLPCGKGKSWDPAWNTCCCGTVHEKKPVTRHTGCCRYALIDLSTQLCCDGYVVDADPQWYHCCGRKPFDPWTQTCCHGYYVVEGKGLCCGYYQVFDHKHQICCGNYYGYYVFNGHPGRTKCCYSKYYGYRAYDTKKELCCYGYIQRGGPHWYCCGYYSYNIKNAMCCRGRIYYRRMFRLLGFCDHMEGKIGSGPNPFDGLAADQSVNAPEPVAQAEPPPAIPDDTP